MFRAGLLLIFGSTIIGTEGDIIILPSDKPSEIEDEFVDEPAAFGDGLPIEGLKGFLVTGYPKDGCKPLAPPPSEDNFTGKWIVLLARYNCDFEQKIRNAQAARYDAVIVHNVNSSDLERMSAKNAVGIRIPSVFVSNDTGSYLENKYSYKNHFYIIMNREVPFDINTHLLLPFAVIVGLCVISMIIFMAVKCVNDRRRALRHRLTNKALKKIPTCRYSKGDPYDTCAICLDDYLEGDKLRVLPCAHAYHCKCIDPWLTKNRRVCPVCKRRVFAAGERRARRLSDTDSDDSGAPLVDHSRTTTQGGTFAPQRENPFAAAERFMQRHSRARGRDEGRAETQDAANETEPYQDAPAEPGAETAASVPFLSGVLNLRNNHFGRNTEDAEPLLAQSSLPAQPSGAREPWYERRARRVAARRAPAPGPRRARRQPAPAPAPAPTPAADHSINSAGGEIGVAALPNTSEDVVINIARA